MSKRKLKQYCKTYGYTLWEKPLDPAGWRVWTADLYGMLHVQEHMHKNIAYSNLWKSINESQKGAARRVV